MPDMCSDTAGTPVREVKVVGRPSEETDRYASLPGAQLSVAVETAAVETAAQREASSAGRFEDPDASTISKSSKSSSSSRTRI
jgi:hypothetical protein